ncbi:EAL domain-containing protein [Massilia sp. PAMC28688]|uniref:putative bifunctional diguanylate cyclase/phosphodiesterase n=1 Tax=Massilia sp. PAMC28688 TaxID=2861283 RepID=UPI001C636FE1|nr:EAL domain-containing protein [Massilia sp. PAMC28688]QYF92425.1 EAL domain-containing protein [Massilia sp. PAMC28688]
MAESALERGLLLARAARALEGEALASALERLEAALHEAQAQPAPAPASALRQHADTFEHASGPVIVLDLAGYLTGWNKGAEAMFGYSAQEAVGQHILFLYTDEGEDCGVEELFLDAGADVIEVQRRKKNGQSIWVRMSLSIIHDQGGEAAGMLVQLTPAVDHLTEAEKTFLHARIIEDSDQGVLITDSRERIVSVNSAFTRITGYSPLEAIGQTPDLLRASMHDATFRTKLRAAMTGDGSWRGEIIGKRKNGELFPQSVTISVVRDDAGAITHTFSLFSDISVHKDAEARMQRMANYDSLTGLPNRVLFSSLLGDVLVQARGGSQFGGVMVVEVARIGTISDTLGHDIANELICEIGRRFRQALRGDDILARLEANKLAIAIGRIEKREHVAKVAQKLLATLAAPMTIGGHTLQAGARIGIATWPDDGMDCASLVRLADVAMARCSDAEDCRFLFYHAEMDQRAKDHMRMEGELRAALAGGQLELHYQPKLSLRSGRIVGAEALLRWRHPERGMVSPCVFIPLAEESGLILDIGSWVLDDACRQIRQWRDQGLDMPPVAVNLSARQFDAHLPARVQAVLRKHGVQPGQLMLEITESLLVQGADAVVSIMNELVAMGMGLALDDFGTGYSSLAYLKRFPISTLKIDRSFVVGLPHEANDCAIARAIVTMAQQLRQEIVAEGVETADQMAFLRDLGCDQLQGYLFSPAVTAIEFARMKHDGRQLDIAR